MNEFVIFACSYMLLGIGSWFSGVLSQSKSEREDYIRTFPRSVRIGAVFASMFLWLLMDAFFLYCLFRGWWTSFKYHHLHKNWKN